MSTRKPMSESDFAAKVEWEGGIVDALEYGLKSEDCEPGKLRDAWKKLEQKWKSMAEDLNAVEDILNDISYEDGDGEESE